MFLSLAECGSYGDGIIKISPVFLSTSLASSFFFHLIFASCVDSYQSEQEIVQRALWFLRMECGTQLCAHPVGCVSYWSVE